MTVASKTEDGFTVLVRGLGTERQRLPQRRIDIGQIPDEAGGGISVSSPSRAAVTGGGEGSAMNASEMEARQVAPRVFLFQRLSDPTRLRVLLALADGGELSISDLAIPIGISPSTVSRHLHELARMGLVRATREGSSKSFRLHPMVWSANGMLNLGRGVRVAVHPN
jgi:DNA-binding transcriptional ArsR family regulator